MRSDADVDLSIIIVSWNARNYLDKCLLSLGPAILNQSAEVLVIDNDSSDGSQELVRRKYPEVQLICNGANLGFAKANNVGIRNSRGRYLFFINSDVVLHQDCISSMIQFMEQHCEIGILGPKILDRNGKTQRSCMAYPTLWNLFCRTFALDNCFPRSKIFGGLLMRYWSYDEVRHVDTLNGCFWMVRREALNQVGPLDESFFMYGEDIDWCKRFREARWSVVFFPGARVVHFGGASSDNEPTRFYVEMWRANFQLCMKHHDGLTQFCFLCLTWIHHLLRLSGHSAIYALKPQHRVQTRFKIKRTLKCIRWLLGVSINRDRIIHGRVG